MKQTVVASLLTTLLCTIAMPAPGSAAADDDSPPAAAEDNWGVEESWAVEEDWSTEAPPPVVITPWYKSTLFWTVVGSIVVVSAGATLVALPKTP